MFDVLIVGGGPAGLSAALALGRCRRKVLICDKGEPRNAASKALHGYLTRDGIAPSEFLRLGREEVLRYPNVQFLQSEIVRAERKLRHFGVHTESGETFWGRILLLATGIVDVLPPFTGMERFYGRSVHHCPYCDGWEHQNQRIAVQGEGVDGAELAVKMKRWSSAVVFCHSAEITDQKALLKLKTSGVEMKVGQIERLEGEGDSIRSILFRDGSRLECSALFISAPQCQRSDLASKLGCKITPSGQIDCTEHLETSIDGVFAIGNASPGLQLVIIAASEGTRVGFSIDEALAQADLADLERLKRTD